MLSFRGVGKMLPRAETRKKNGRFTDILVFHLFWHIPSWYVNIYIYKYHPPVLRCIHYLFSKKNSLAHWYMAPNFHHIHLPTIIIFCAKTTKCCANRPWTESGRRMDRSYPLNLSMLGRRKLQNEIFSQIMVQNWSFTMVITVKNKKFILTISKLLGDTLETKIAF